MPKQKQDLTPLQKIMAAGISGIAEKQESTPSQKPPGV